MFGSNFLACHEDALSVFANAGYEVEPIWLKAEYAWPEVRHSYFLVDRRILLRRDTGNMELDDHWYGFNNSATAELVNRLNLPSKIG
jgi:hypothetical protein